MKSILTLLTTIILLFSLSGCATTSPEVIQLLNKNGIKEIEVCRDSGMLATKCKGSMCWPDQNECDSSHVISTEEANQYITKKVKADKISKSKAEADKISQAKAEESYKAFEIERERSRIAQKEKVESEIIASAKADKNAKDQEVRVTARMIKHKIDVEEMIDLFKNSDEMSLTRLGRNKGITEPITDKHVDIFLQQRDQDQAKDQALKIANAKYEKNAKIHEGKQYICSDGHDSWVLKYNGGQFTFGEVNFNYLTSNWQSMPKIDRVNGTVTYNGNKTTCKPR